MIGAETPMLDEAEQGAAVPGMDDKELLALLETELADAEQYTDVLIGEERAKALDYYLRRPMGDERDGRSKVISAEVYKVVEGVSTAVANIFASAKNPIEFVPRKAEDVLAAEQRTAAVNYVFYSQNNGFLALLESIKDGVQAKTGFLTWRWETERRVTQERYREQTPESLALLLQDNEAVQLVSHQEKQGPEGLLIDCVVNVIHAAGKCVVEAVPPEEVLVSSRARSADVQKSPCVIWRTHKTKAELLKCGYAQEVVDQLAFTGGRDDQQMQRVREETDTNDGEARIYTAWLDVDADGDGIVELRRVVWSEDVVIANEITDEINLSAWTPNIQPHEFFGRCPADDATESQEVMTSIKRQTLDNLYLANNPMWRVDTSDTRVNIEDFYSPEIGRPMRAPKDGADAIIFPFVAQHSFPMLEYEQADQENKTGFTRYAQGLDAQSMNKTARGVSILTNMSQQRVQLMARIYGELCLKPAMRGIAKLLSQHGDKALMFRINGSYVEVDPREWKEEFDMTVSVGMGTTDRDQQLMHLMTIAQAQAQAVQGGMLGRLVSEKNLYNVQSKIAENAGFKDPSFAWLNPETVEPAQQQPDPEMLRQQAETERQQAQLQADMQKAQMQIEAERETQAMKLQTDERVTLSKAQIDAEAKVQIAEISARAQPTVNVDSGGAMSEAAQTLQQQVMQQGEALMQVMEVLAANQQAMLQALARMSAPRRLVRGPDGRAAGIETVEMEG